MLGNRIKADPFSLSLLPSSLHRKTIFTMRITTRPCTAFARRVGLVPIVKSNLSSVHLIKYVLTKDPVSNQKTITAGRFGIANVMLNKRTLDYPTWLTFVGRYPPVFVELHDLVHHTPFARMEAGVLR